MNDFKLKEGKRLSREIKQYESYKRWLERGTKPTGIRRREHFMFFSSVITQDEILMDDDMYYHLILIVSEKIKQLQAAFNAL